MSVIKNHIINRIKSQIKDKQDSINFNGFFYFDDIVNDKEKRIHINRLNRENAFPNEKTYPISFYNLSGLALISIFTKLKQNDFYLYKKINGKEHKIRLKKKDVHKR